MEKKSCQDSSLCILKYSPVKRPIGSTCRTTAKCPDAAATMYLCAVLRSVTDYLSFHEQMETERSSDWQVHVSSFVNKPKPDLVGVICDKVTSLLCLRKLKATTIKQWDDILISLHLWKKRECSCRFIRLRDAEVDGIKCSGAVTIEAADVEYV